MAVDDVGLDLGGAPGDVRERGEVARSDLPAHGDPAQTKRQLRGNAQASSRLRAAGDGVGDEPDPVPARGHATRKVDDVPKEAAHRRAQDVEHVEPAVCRVRHWLVTFR